MKKGFFILAFFFSLYLFYLQGSSWPFQQNKTDQLIYLCQEEFQTLDPARAQDYSSLKVIANIYEGLVRFKPGSFEVEPCLATGWKASQDKLNWTFKLRPGVTFHDGTPFDAAAVKYSFDRQINNLTANTSMVFGMVESIQVLDRLTVRFKLKFPYAPFLNNLALPFVTPIVSPAAQKDGGDPALQPAGTGPYMLEKREQEREIILKENPLYWGEKPALKKIIFRTESDAAKRKRLILSGRADVIDAAPEDIPALENKGIKIWRVPGADISYLGFYTNKKPFQDPGVRQAACRAIDQPRLLQELFGENAIPAKGPLPPGILGHAQELRQLPYDPQESRRLLAAAGYPRGLPITIITYAGERPYNPAGGEKLARALAKQLAGAGFKTRVVVHPWEKFKKALLDQEGDAFLYGWISDNGDPDNFLYTLFSSAQITTGLNATRYHNQRIDTLLITAQRTPDPILRARLYQDIQKQLLQETPAFFINHSLLAVAASPAVSDLTLHPGGFIYFQNAKKQNRNKFSPNNE
ncbi:MAG: ABC transporter substrate-binding protein [Bacillota bacterium]